MKLVVKRRTKNTKVMLILNEQKEGNSYLAKRLESKVLDDKGFLV
jgi:hypothetical protein